MLPTIPANFAAAIGIGLMIGLERERRRSAGGGRAPGGVRTFTLAAFAGAVAMHTGHALLLSVVTFGVSALVAVAYARARDQDPGTTTEIALILTVILGGLAMDRPALAAGSAVVVTILLAARSRLHGFARDTLTEMEVRDGLMLAAAALVVWPLLPDRAVDPFGALNLKNVWMLVVLVMCVSAIGYVGTRVAGPRLGLPFVGFASGFVSSSATIAAMAERAREAPALLMPAVTGATLSTVATFLQLGLVLATIAPPLLPLMAPSLAAAGIVSIVYAAAVSWRSASAPHAEEAIAGRPFNPKSALLLAVTISIVLFVTAAINQLYGTSGVLLGAALSGFADAHSSSAGVANLVAAKHLEPHLALLPILAAVSTNGISKIVIAMFGGDNAFAKRIVPGQLLVLGALWGAAWATWPPR